MQKYANYGTDKSMNRNHREFPPHTFLNELECEETIINSKFYKLRMPSSLLLNVLFTMCWVAMATRPSSGKDWNYIKINLAVQCIFRNKTNKKVTKWIYYVIILYLFWSWICPTKKVTPNELLFPFGQFWWGAISRVFGRFTHFLLVRAVAPLTPNCSPGCDLDCRTRSHWGR